MILNPESLPAIKTFKCKSKLIMRYFVYEQYLSLFSIKDGMYMFVDNDQFKKALKECPVWLKLLIYAEGLN